MASRSRRTSESLDNARRDGDPVRPGRLLSAGELGRRVREKGYRFEFTQLLWILERACSEWDGFGENVHFGTAPVRLRPSPDLVFPPSDIENLVAGDERLHVVATFHGLYGIDSPLPYHFYEPLSRRTRDTRPNRDFLDIFNHRFYAFFYRAWKKWRPALHFRMEECDEHSRRFLSLAGFVPTKGSDRQSVPRMRVAAFAGLLGSRHRNSEGLEALLSGFLGQMQIDVVENVPRWVSIPSRPQLGGGGLMLGAGATIGEEVFDRSGKFRIRLGPLSLEQYHSLLPGGEAAARVDKLVRMYVPDHLAYDVQLSLPAEELPATALGESGSQLGYTTSLGQPGGGMMSRIVSYE